MNTTQRLHLWNRRYDALPDSWRFQVVVWSLVAVSFINMVLTIAIRFPFGLLTLLGILFVAAIRFPYSAGWIVSDAGHSSATEGKWRLEARNAGWLVGLNRRYDALPEMQRFWLIAVILLLAGIVSMALTAKANVPFGLFFLLVILAIIAIRAPYSAGVLKADAPAGRPALPETTDPLVARAPGPDAGTAAYPIQDTAPDPVLAHPETEDVTAGVPETAEPPPPSSSATPVQTSLHGLDEAPEPGAAPVERDPAAHPIGPPRTNDES